MAKISTISLFEEQKKTQSFISISLNLGNVPSTATTVKKTSKSSSVTVVALVTVMNNAGTLERIKKPTSAVVSSNASRRKLSAIILQDEHLSSTFIYNSEIRNSSTASPSHSLVASSSDGTITKYLRVTQ
nr:CNT_HP1_G0007120.mRNA.1.CDS.1 [Saccharomyces cerevisiae]